MFMPGRIIKYLKGKENLDDISKIIKSRDQLFIATIKAHIPTERLNEFINFFPIFRNITLESTTLSPKGCVRTGERKLTQLSSTMGEFMTFSNYYLWFLID
jgi:hypothetical protein